jgi:hypothetical protein
MKLLKRTTKIDMFMASASSRDSVGEAQTEIEPRCASAIGSSPGRIRTSIRSQQEIAQTADQTSKQMSALLAAIASISPSSEDRDHEHHARVRDRADPGDRHPDGESAPRGATSSRSS